MNTDVKQECVVPDKLDDKNLNPKKVKFRNESDKKESRNSKRNYHSFACTSVHLILNKLVPRVKSTIRLDIKSKTWCTTLFLIPSHQLRPYHLFYGTAVIDSFANLCTFLWACFAHLLTTTLL
jgi:hypothetical protein